MMKNPAMLSAAMAMVAAQEFEAKHAIPAALNEFDFAPSPRGYKYRGMDKPARDADQKRKAKRKAQRAARKRNRK